MKLTNKAKKELNIALQHLKRSFDYIHSPDIAVARRKSSRTTTEDYWRLGDGKALIEVNKQCGSDLCGLEDAIFHLSNFIDNN